MTPLAAWLDEQTTYAQKARRCAAVADQTQVVPDLANRLESTAELLRLAVSVVDEARNILPPLGNYLRDKIAVFDAAVSTCGRED